ncbi:50S ribosomal protein L4 [Fonsecaea pedrosoi CBS 271.37]|uniref:Large ribosomal subunit protein uL4m n=1 Tax=Fonsecaea pedrosoi CBS 271.37 TaxID=1442368 RepID=A0A0D2E8V5_9EURO|nr:50S ribosomal protein L4 [Fonsecaea pedrosoi CBS 271.37]KIW86526.1 50S ribosomal protein L4 [Fonsecaea pedrosoi CBS 271.37]
MQHTSASRSLLGLARRFNQLNVADPLTQCLAPRLGCRTIASQTQPPVSTLTTDSVTSRDSFHLGNLSIVTSPTPGLSTSPSSAELHALDHPVLATLYSWPHIEPARYALYGSRYLDAPLRRDLLHRAVIYEADATRQGTASTKWRFEVHGSNRKLYQQKGTGRARVRDKKSPIRRGGGVAFGPKPRDFSSELQKKVYHQAFRIALSYRFRRNELIILNDKINLPTGNGARFLNNIFEANCWGQGYGRSLLVTSTPESSGARIFEEMETIGEHGDLKDIEDVDVKDLLTSGRVVIERSALLSLLCKEQTFKENGTVFTYEKALKDVKLANKLQVPEKVVQYL